MTRFENRETVYPIQELLLSRTSSRAFSQESITDEELFSLFEAAHWAPSSYNSQPWRFVYARKGDPYWDGLFDVLVDFNKSWCQHADTLVVIISRKHFEHNDKPSVTASFDVGAAWMSLAIEAHKRGIIAHGMSGFDYEKLKRHLNVADVFNIEAMIAIGKRGVKDSLPAQLKDMETPSLRKSINEVVSNGVFNFK